MKRRSFLTQTLCAATSLALSLGSGGCKTPASTAEALFGRWQSGNAVLIFTPHGVYSIYRGGARAEAGLFGVPHSNEILVSQAVGRYSLRNLWQIQQLDKDQLKLAFPDGTSMAFARAKPIAALDSQLVGLWQAPAGDTDWNYYELTAEGNYIQILWWGTQATGFRRVVAQGLVHVEKSKLVFTNHRGEFHDFDFTVAKDSLHLTNAMSKIDVVYTRVESAKSLERV